MTTLGYFYDVSPFLCLYGSLLLLILYVIRYRHKYRNFPPGPRGLPIVGYLPFVKESFPTTYMELAEKYGPIFSVDIGLDRTVVLNSFDTIQEAGAKRGDAFSGRPYLHIQAKPSNGLGLTFHDYDLNWKAQRKFGISTLRGLGMGKLSIEEKIVEELGYLCDVLADHDGEAVDYKNTLSKAIANGISSIVTGSRFRYDDEKFNDIVAKFTTLIGVNPRIMGILILVPATRFLPVFRREYNTRMKAMQDIQVFFCGIIEEHKLTFAATNIRDFIDVFLNEMETTNHNDSFSENQLIHYVTDLFMAGTNPTTSALRWGIVALALFPEYQQKIFEEILNTIGESGIPTVKKRDRMPFACAFMHEVMRHRTIGPLAFPHRATTDVSFFGYDLPKNTRVVFNLWAVQHDPKHFKDPSAFRPERFLDEDGCFIPDNRVIPFSVGSRHCIAEQFAKMEIFLFLIGIVQKFKIFKDPNSPLPDFYGISFEPFLQPKGFKIILRQR